jgi:hypothetical protein
LPPAGPAFYKNALNPFYLSRGTILEDAIVSFLKKLCHYQLRHKVKKAQRQKTTKSQLQENIAFPSTHPHLCAFVPVQHFNSSLLPNIPISKIRKAIRKKVIMYNYMVLQVEEKKMFRDFLAYYKRNPEDDLYYVSIDNPQLIKQLEEFIERRNN